MVFCGSSRADPLPIFTWEHLFFWRCSLHLLLRFFVRLPIKAPKVPAVVGEQRGRVSSYKVHPHGWMQCPGQANQHLLQEREGWFFFWTCYTASLSGAAWILPLASFSCTEQAQPTNHWKKYWPQKSKKGEVDGWREGDRGRWEIGVEGGREREGGREVPEQTPGAAAGPWEPGQPQECFPGLSTANCSIGLSIL